MAGKKKPWGDQHTAAYLLLCVKTTFTKTDIWKYMGFPGTNSWTVFPQSKRYILVLRAGGFFFLFVSLVKELDGCLRLLVKEMLDKEPCGKPKSIWQQKHSGNLNDYLHSEF